MTSKIIQPLYFIAILISIPLTVVADDSDSDRQPKLIDMSSQPIIINSSNQKGESLTTIKLGSSDGVTSTSVLEKDALTKVHSNNARRIKITGFKATHMLKTGPNGKMKIFCDHHDTSIHKHNTSKEIPTL